MYKYKAKVVKVVDGDTLDVMVDLGFDIWTKVRLRLAGIDTPEMNTDAGSVAKDYVQSLVNIAKEVNIETRKTDKYGRYVAKVYLSNGEKSVDGQLVFLDLNQDLQLKGLAVKVNY